MSLEGINVCIRVRPFIQREIDAKEVASHDWIVDGENNSIQSTVAGKKQMNFDRVFDNYSTNDVVYEEAAKRIIDSAFEGVNGSILAYGMTSSGKTYTMSSIMKQAFGSIFSRTRSDKSRNYEVSASYCEVYNENITDLADPTKTGLSVSQDSGLVRDLTIRSFASEQDVLRFHEEGTKNRRVGATKMNSESSRSHSIFQVFIKSTPVDTDKQQKSSLPQGVRSAKAVATAGTLEATINFVDLAGSERASQTEAKGERLQEGAQINKSLLVLGKVIRSLASRKNEQPPYRESKLTQLLRRSLGGNCRTTMICCVTMAKSNIGETTSTLSFAVNAKNVVNTVGVNETLDDKQMLIRAQERYQMLRLKFLQFYEMLKSQNVVLSPEMDQFMVQLSAQKGAMIAPVARSTVVPPTTPSSSTASLEAQLGELGAELAGMGGQLVPISKKQRLVQSGNASDNALVTLGDIPPHVTMSVPVDTSMQTDLSILSKMLNTTADGNNTNVPQMAKKRKSMTEGEDKDSSQHSSVIWYDEPLEIQPNTAKVMEFLGYANADESLSEFFDQNFAQLEEDLTNMLVSNGLFVDTRVLHAQIDDKSQEVVALKKQYDEMHAKFTQMVTELQETIQENKTKADAEVLALKNKIAEYDSQLQTFESTSSTHQLELQSTMAKFSIDKSSLEQEIKQLKDQIEQMNAQHLDAITQFTETVQSKDHIRANELQQIMGELERVQAEYQQYKDDTELILEENEHDQKKAVEQLEAERDEEVSELRKVNDKLRNDHKAEYSAQIAKFEAVRNSLLDELQEVEENSFKEYSALEAKLAEAEQQYNTQITGLHRQVELANQKLVESETKIQFLQQENNTKLELLTELRQQKEKELQFISERVKSVAGDKDKVITTMESELSTLRQYQLQQQSTYESLQAQYRMLETESGSLKRENAEFRVQITTKDYELQRIRTRAEEVAKKHREDSETLVKRFKDKITKITTDRDVELEKKENEITRLKELQQAFAVKVKKSISEAKAERDQALEQVELKEKEKRRLEHENDAIKLRYTELQKGNAQLKVDIAMVKETSHSLETAVSEEASLKKFHIQENLMLKKQAAQVDQRWNDHFTTHQQKADRELSERNRIIQSLEAQLQQKQNELEYYKQNNQETVNKLGQSMAENQTLKMQLQQQSAMSLVSQQPPMSVGSHYSSSLSSGLPMRPAAAKKAPIYDDSNDLDMEQTEQLPRPFAHSTNYSSTNLSSSLTASPYKRMELTKPVASSRPKPEVVKFVGSRTTRAAAARSRQLNDENV